MLNVFLRQYRRLGLFSFGMASMFLAIVSRLGLGMTQLGHLIFFFSCILIFAALSLALFRVKPGQRGLLEISGFSSIISTIAMIYLPHAGMYTPLVALGVFFGVLTVTWFFLQSRLSQKIGARTTWRDRHSGECNYPPKLIWKHIIPGASAPQDHCTGIVEKYIDDIEDEDTIQVFFRPRRSGQAQYTITFLERESPTFCRFYFEGNEADGTLVDGVFSLAIEVEDRGHCTVIVNEERSGLSLGAMIERWFDDALGFQHDRLIALLDERYGEGAGVTRPLADSTS